MLVDFRNVGETIICTDLLVIQWKHVRQCSHSVKQKWRNPRKTKTVSLQRASVIISGYDQSTCSCNFHVCSCRRLVALSKEMKTWS